MIREASEETLRSLLARQREAFLRDGPPSAKVRIDRIDRCIGLLVDHQDELAAAVDADFGCRSPLLTKFTDISASLDPLKQARRNVRRWMRRERRATTPAIIGWIGGGAEIQPHPVGVVGLIAPWNFPISMVFSPLASVLAAGNRCLIKPSEYTPKTADLLARLVAGAFDETEIAVCTGGPAVGEAFSRLPFDHLLFTGSTGVGRQIMRAAADNLVPVTLELGGKSPTIIGRSADIESAARRIMAGKTMNAGQICIAPDYVLLPADRREAFVKAAVAAVARMFPTLANNPEYTSILNERHVERLQAMLADARAGGARLVEANPAGEDLGRSLRKLAPVLILDPEDSMRVMQEEIFGPLLPVKTYETIDDAIAYVNARPRPLALYYFGEDRDEEQRVLARTTSGGVTVNDVIMHVAMTELPFGGIGPSGMGVYHGIEGFRRFSHMKPVFREPSSWFVEQVLARMRPPYRDAFRRMVARQIRR
ncbi:MAG: coniferyl aldehyde dehydrogenase [Planctomycetia bacterium]